MSADRVRLVVRGRVQGVSFRAATVDAARRIAPLRGFVRNLDDGSVEVVAEGERPALEALVEWCRRGPRLARVDDVRASWEPARGDVGPFDIAF